LATEERKVRLQSIRVVVHAMTDDTVAFYDQLNDAAKSMMKAGIVKDIQLVEESIRVLIPWNKLRKELGIKDEQQR
jgi:hypothetical protein